MTRFSGVVVTRDIGRRGCGRSFTTWGPQRLAIERLVAHVLPYVAVPSYAVFRRMARRGPGSRIAFPVGLSYLLLL